MNIKQRRLPSAYQEVEWIRASGNQYIITNIPFNTIGKIEIMGYYTESASGWKLDGLGDTSKNCYIGNSGATIYIGNGGDLSTGISLTPWISTIAKYTLDYINGVFTLGDNRFTFTPILTEDTRTFPIFGAYSSSSTSVGYRQTAKKTRARFWDRNLNLIGDLISCYRISDSVIGMYDTIGGTFYTNQGSGTFTKGADVVTVDAITIPEGSVRKIEDSLGNVLWSNKPAGALYWYGDECTELTGGWQLRDSYGTLVKASDHMEFSFNTNTAILTTANQINILNYRTLKAEAMISQGNVSNMDIRFSPDWSRVTLPKFTNQYSIQLKDFVPDITRWTEFQYIWAVGQYASTSTGTILIKRIWLE